MKTYDSGYQGKKKRISKKGEGGVDHVRRAVASLSNEKIQRMMNDNSAGVFKKGNDGTGRGIFSKIQAKMEISQPQDAAEIQADKVAEGVIQGNPKISKAALSQNPTAEINTKGEGNTMQTTDAFDSQLQSTKGQGQKLDNNTRSELEQHTGTDLSGVNVHTSSNASEMSENINAKAFTHGQDIYFKQGQYNTTSTEGKSLLAHEVAHTVQQKEGKVQPKIQRGEADTRLGKGKIKDTKEDINTYVNDALDQARQVYKNLSKSLLQNMIWYFFWKVGEADRGKRAPIENWAETLPKDKVYKPEEKETKYGDKLTFGAWDVILFRPDVVSATMMVNNIYIGTDKLGHFFQQGYEYYKKYKEGVSNKEIEEYGDKLEKEIYGLGDNTMFGSGVYSFADLEANRTGFQFYKDFEKNPDIIFDISNYINDQWNEEINQNMYNPEIAPDVWGNLLRGIWKGKLNEGGLSKDVDFYLSLLPVGTKTVDKTKGNKKFKTSKILGGYSYTNDAGKSVKGTLTGDIVYNENDTFKAIESIWLDFNWKNTTDEKTGAGMLKSEDESTLSGNFDMNTYGKTKLIKA